MFNRKKAYQMYTSFPEEARDMSFQEFCKELDEMTDPKKTMELMQSMSLTHKIMNGNKRKIEEALRNKSQGVIKL